MRRRRADADADAAYGYALSLRRLGFAHADLDPWLAEAFDAIERQQTTVAEHFVTAIATGDANAARAALDGHVGGPADLMRAYLKAYTENDMASAEALLAAPGAGAFAPAWVAGRPA
ncbi:MAG: hypothetical protein R3C16_04310 [Hyphomonadaceae bacterium]